MKSRTGILLIIGSVIFLVSVFNPYMFRFFDNPDDPQAQISAIADYRVGWTIANIGTAVGSVIIAIGMFMLMRLIRDFSNQSWHTQLSNWSTILMGIAATVWVIVTYTRIVPPAEQVVMDTQLSWAFDVYTLLILISIVMMGVVLFQSRYLRWVGLVVAVLEVLTVMMFLPLTHYVMTLVIGIAMLLSKPTPTDPEG